MGAGRILVLLTGFMTGSRAYDALVAPMRDEGWQVVVPRLYPRGVSTLLGAHDVEQEAVDAAALVRSLADASMRTGRGVVLAGHSRGGQAAWRAANLLTDHDVVDALVLLDPVDGTGRAPSERTATCTPASFHCPALVVGAGLGGRCAPAAVNHEAFAEAAPAARHAVVPDLGHGDILDGRARSFSRWLCGGAADPDDAREAVAALLRTFARDHVVVDDPRVTVVR